MKIEVLRSPSNEVCTPGRLFIDGVFECFTLEDVVRDLKIYGETAIPAGSYRVDVTYSPHFKRDLPLLLDVPNYSGVRVHPGNTAADTEGCILLGKTAGHNCVNYSRVAFDDFYAKVLAAHQAEEAIWLQIGPA